MTMADLNLILSIASFIGVCVFLAMEWNQSKTIKQMQNDIYNNYDALDKQLYDLDYKYSCQIRDVRNGYDHVAQSHNEQMKKKYDNLCNSHSATEDRLSDLASRVWMVEGNVETLQPYIKRLGLKQLIKTSGTINKEAVKELKEIENELK